MKGYEGMWRDVEGYLIGGGNFGHFGLDDEVLRLDVFEFLRQSVAEVVQNAQVLDGLVFELLRRHGDEAQVGLVGDDIADKLPRPIRIGLIKYSNDYRIEIVES